MVFSMDHDPRSSNKDLESIKSKKTSKLVYNPGSNDHRFLKKNKQHIQKNFLS